MQIKTVLREELLPPNRRWYTVLSSEIPLPRGCLRIVGWLSRSGMSVTGVVNVFVVSHISAQQVSPDAISFTVFGWPTSNRR